MALRSMALASFLAAVLAALLVGPATAQNKQSRGGTVVIGADQEPATLNFYLTDGNSYTTALAMNPVLAPGAYYNQKAQLVPELLAGLPRMVKSNPLTVTFAYKKSAKWSDGKPVTGKDFIATYRTIMNPKWDITS